jgi:hypothetical protein
MRRAFLGLLPVLAVRDTFRAGSRPLQTTGSGPAPTLKLPQIQKRQLSNGLAVWIVELHEVPVAQVNLIVMAGTADDPAGKYGIASLTTAMLSEGAGTRGSLEIADAVDFLGADSRRRERRRLLGGPAARAGGQTCATPCRSWPTSHSGRPFPKTNSSGCASSV